jgi:crotonobetainyl-CoA:carnitine CoA-transferase CaiB-like acyl-CoA transferase
VVEAGKGALAGVRVLDFTRVLAGPLCTMLLGDLGADVLKVEHPGSGDESRQWGPPWAGRPEDGLSAYFASANRNKRGVTLNLKTADGRDLARRLAAQSHIVIENFRVGAMAEFGLG